MNGKCQTNLLGLRNTGGGLGDTDASVLFSSKIIDDVNCQMRKLTVTRELAVTYY